MKKEFIREPVLLPIRKTMRMRAKYNMSKESKGFLHRAIRNGKFSELWMMYVLDKEDREKIKREMT